MWLYYVATERQNYSCLGSVFYCIYSGQAENKKTFIMRKKTEGNQNNNNLHKPDGATSFSASGKFSVKSKKETPPSSLNLVV